MTMIAVTQTATRYDLRFPDFDPKARETWAAMRDVKALPGRTFDPTEKVWRIPLSAGAKVRQLAEKYGAQIEELAIAGGYSEEQAHRIAELEAQLAAVPRIGDDNPPPPRNDLEAEVARLRAEVARLTEDNARLVRVLRLEKDKAGAIAVAKRSPKPRTGGKGYTGVAKGTRKPAKASGKAHGDCAEHWRIEGMQRPICVLGKRRDLPAQTADEVVGFAEEIVQIAATQGDVLKRLMAEQYAAKVAAGR